MTIGAGRLQDIDWHSGYWVFLDIGFSGRSRTNGLLLHDSHPKELLFSEAVDEVIAAAERQGRLNLVIEAPLSAAFDPRGNPRGRSVEKRGGQTRYWYVGPGCAVMVAATYLLQRLRDSDPNADIRLFEGFVSYKDRHTASRHSQDVELLREVVRSPAEFAGAIVAGDDLAASADDAVVSAFAVAGMDFGVPPVIIRDA
jgi:hypothetical protein